MTLKGKINDLLANDKLAEAIDILLPVAEKEDKAIYNTLILLKARYNSNEKDNNKCVLTRDDYIRSKNQIINSLQGTIDGLEQDILSAEFYQNIPPTMNEPNSLTAKEINGYKEQLELLTDKKMMFEKELITVYDAEKNFALKQQINELEEKINGLKKRKTRLAYFEGDTKPVFDKRTEMYKTLFVFGSENNETLANIEIQIDFENKYEKINSSIRSQLSAEAGRLERWEDPEKKYYKFNTNILKATNYVVFETLSKEILKITSLKIEP